MLDKRSSVTGEQCGTGNMLTGRSIKPGAGSVSKKQLCHLGGKVGNLVRWRELVSGRVSGSHPHRHWRMGAAWHGEAERQELKWWAQPTHAHTLATARVHGHSYVGRGHTDTPSTLRSELLGKWMIHINVHPQKRERERRKRERDWDLFLDMI